MKMDLDKEEKQKEESKSRNSPLRGESQQRGQTDFDLFLCNLSHVKTGQKFQGDFYQKGKLK